MRSVYFYVIITGDFERLQYFNFETSFLEKLKPFLRAGVQFFSSEYCNNSTQHFRTKLPCQKPMLIQIEWGVQNRPITKNRVLPLNSLLF